MDTVRSFIAKPWLYLFIIIFGTFLKFSDLSVKFFWEDEVSTVLYTTGMKIPEIKNKIPHNEIIKRSYFDSLLHPIAKQYSLQEQLSGILSDTHLTPAHYIFLLLWYRIVGDDPIAYRLFSIFVFLISLPFIFLLAKMLFNSRLAGWVATSLYSVSPYVHLKVQEARYYSLWVCIFIISNYFFLRAIRQNKTISWILYSIFSIAALYTSALSGLMILGHFLYVIFYNKQQLKRFIFFLLVTVAVYSPWLYFLFTVRDVIQDGLRWQMEGFPTYYSLGLLYFQLIGFTKSFTYLLDNSIYVDPLQGNMMAWSLIPFFCELFVLIFILYAIFFLYRKGMQETSTFLLLILIPLFLFFYFSDLFRTAFTSRLWKYQIVNMVAILLIVTNLLNDKILKGKLLFAYVFVCLATLGIFSIMNTRTRRCWSTRNDCYSNIENAEIIANANKPLIITDFAEGGLANFMALLNDSKTDKIEILYLDGTIESTRQLIEQKSYSDIYVIHASYNLVRRLEYEFGNAMSPLDKKFDNRYAEAWHIKPNNQ